MAPTLRSATKSNTSNKSTDCIACGSKSYNLKLYLSKHIETTVISTDYAKCPETGATIETIISQEIKQNFYFNKKYQKYQKCKSKKKE